MKKLGVFVIIVLFIPARGISQSVKSVVDVPKQEIRILSGNPEYYKKAGTFHILFDYSDLIIGGYADEKAFIKYMREDAELRKKNANKWEEKWFSDRKNVFEPKFLELFNKYAGSKIKLSQEDKGHNFLLVLHTQFIEIGFIRNFQKSPTYINAMAIISDKNGTKEPLVISMKYVIGSEVMDSFSEDYRRIEEAYAKCGKELARYMSKKIY